MTIRNTASDYGSIAKWLHWVTAFCMLGAFGAVYYRVYLTDMCDKYTPLAECDPDNRIALFMHTGLGLTVGVLILLRIAWRLTNKQPQLEPGSRLEHAAAHLGHYALYAVIIAMPLTGWLGVGGNPSWFGLFEVTGVRSTAVYDLVVTNWMGLTYEEFEKPIDWIHKTLVGTYIFWLLFAVHVAAGIYHHVCKRDRTLVRMLPKGWLKDPSP